MAHYDLNWLRQFYDDKKNVDFLFFWGHTNKTGQPVGPFIFSQWYPSPFTVDSITYSTAEHWMMTEKARLFGDAEIAERVIGAKTPKEAKELGRAVRGFDVAAWEQSCFSIVREGNRHKFIQNAGYKEYLLGTGNRVLVEASPVDAIWGIGLAADSAQAKVPHQWRGKNLLGFALMEVRDLLSA